jgi:hypothetical protein
MASKMLDSYWKSRGVWDEDTRNALVSIGHAATADKAPEISTTAIQQLPGLPSTWQISGIGRSEVIEASRRLLRLNELLGGSTDMDIAWMVTREPDLLTADFNLIISRLLQMKSMSSGDIDVLQVVSKQPSLLLNDEDWLKAIPVSSTDEDTSREILRSWEAGVVSDNDPEWVERYNELKDYRSKAGDTNVGFGRSMDSPSLARWAAKQRLDFKSGDMADSRKTLLDEIGFEWDESEAEFKRWYLELKVFRDLNGHTNLNTLSAGDDLYLYNWCAVQRIALRCRILSEKRKGLLDDLDFDWTGADPLS